ncbi:50S ribosomal protein L34e [Candidatus Woesearchaeota archaeon]|nr:50S ribosomal protein L34e [Candidatus Woesearchaeota archaeon]
MPQPYKRSRSLRRVHIRVPGGKTKLHYRKRKPGKAHCSSCGAVLKGVLRERPNKMSSIPKTKKRPERPYAGSLCSKCMRLLIIGKARSL